MGIGASAQRSMRSENHCLPSHRGMMIVAAACWRWTRAITFGISVMGGTTQLLSLHQHWVSTYTASAPTLKKRLLKWGRQVF